MLVRALTMQGLTRCFLIGYRIRNNEAFDSLFPITDVIYDGQNFESPFITDLSK